MPWSHLSFIPKRGPGVRVAEVLFINVVISFEPQRPRTSIINRGMQMIILSSYFNKQRYMYMYYEYEILLQNIYIGSMYNGFDATCTCSIAWNINW